MALMLAGRVLEVRDGTAVVDVAGETREAKLDFIQDVKPGDYVTIYYGIVLEKVSKKDAEETLAHCSYSRGKGLKVEFSLSGLETMGFRKAK
ncbi:HypC/HybG/HupF family hydrogenase formation chaperone [Thermococcus sp.]|uniref:HypC/HybG/HupF family hydrogenase formation chaperone n=1 Tax=Thermococcus sp. TaxID=35749 RepID=UPI0025D528B0|nr:HypC/HybG/HupF family hydrogenase formation chaperone [Thermococcus sp.]